MLANKLGTKISLSASPQQEKKLDTINGLEIIYEIE